eukprot:1158552-Pelagomonas_calceolata.AAC.6
MCGPGAAAAAVALIAAQAAAPTCGPGAAAAAVALIAAQAGAPVNGDIGYNLFGVWGLFGGCLQPDHSADLLAGQPHVNVLASGAPHGAPPALDLC